MSASHIALVGDYSPGVPAHRAIPRALELARDATGSEVSWRWVHTNDLRDAPRELALGAGVWVVPASPYANMDGALEAIRWARKRGGFFSGRAAVFSKP